MKQPLPINKSYTTTSPIPSQEEIEKQTMGELEQEFDDLIKRIVYCRKAPSDGVLKSLGQRLRQQSLDN